MENNPSAAMYIGLAALRDDQLNKLKALESEMGVVLIALKPSVPLVQLNQAGVERLQLIEKDLGVILLACQKQA